MGVAAFGYSAKRGCGNEFPLYAVIRRFADR